MVVDMIKEQYQKEISKIHVPEALLESTKQAMKEEEERLKRQSGMKKIFSTGRVLSAVAAVLLLTVSAMLFSLKTEKSSPEQAVPLQLGGGQEPGIGQIEKGNDTGLTVRKVSEMPEEFGNIKSITIGAETVFITTDTETGAFVAYYEKEETYYKVLSDITEEEKFIEALKEKIKELYKES